MSVLTSILYFVIAREPRHFETTANDEILATREVNLLSFTGNFELKLDKTHLGIDVKVLGLTFVKLAGFSF